MTAARRVLTYGQRLRYFRRLLRLQQDELARKVGCSIQTISNQERDVHRPSVNLLRRLDEALRVKVETAEVPEFALQEAS